MIGPARIAKLLLDRVAANEGTNRRRSRTNLREEEIVGSLLEVIDDAGARDTGQPAIVVQPRKVDQRFELVAAVMKAGNGQLDCRAGDIDNPQALAGVNHR